MKKIEMQDWIILRLVFHSIGLLEGVVDAINAVTYLHEKYGYKTMCKAIDALHEEYKND